jgi:VacB/RNase II family 3'-5' exoribonuclease
MPRRRVRVQGVDLTAEFENIRRELLVAADFPAEVSAAAQLAAEKPGEADTVEDATDLPFVTVDPPGSMDLDQAFYLECHGDGYRVHYAIADVGFFVSIGDIVDAEARRRVETLYCPDKRVPLHPPVLAEGAASLLPGVIRPALHWCLTLDAAGDLTETSVRRAMIRRRERLDYATVQMRIDSSQADASLSLLKTVGELRLVAEERRDAVDLGRPEQVVVGGAAGWTVGFRTPLSCERWNAQLSLLTGMAAAQLMMDAKVGVLRTLPAPADEAVQQLQATAKALGIDWPTGHSYARVLRTLDRTEDRVAALLAAATVLLRGAGYTAFDGELPQQRLHSGVGAPYAHATAPLRRLVDRFVSELCLCIVHDESVPADLRESVPALPKLMAAGARQASAVERESIDLVEAAVLQHRVGDLFSGVVVAVHAADDTRAGSGTLQLQEPAVLARCHGDLVLGQRVQARLTKATIAERSVEFEKVTEQ